MPQERKKPNRKRENWGKAVLKMTKPGSERLCQNSPIRPSDIQQDVVVKLLENKVVKLKHVPFATMLRNCFFSMLRLERALKRGGGQVISLSAQEHEPVDPFENDQPDARAQASELLEQVFTAIAEALTQDQSAKLLARTIQQKTLTEIAQEYHVSAEAIRRLILRAIRRVRQVINLQQ